MMRTTLTLDNDIYVQVKQLAQAEKKSIGRVISDAIRKGLERSVYIPIDDDFPVIPVRADSGFINLEIVNQLRD